MSIPGNLIIKKYSVNPKSLFLVDSLGGLISAIMLGFILVRFESLFGVPPSVLYVLSGIACLFFIYSFLCYLKELENWRVYMKIIAVMNMLYCCFTILLISFHYQKVTIFGLLYFVVEVIIISILAVVEFKNASI